MQELMVFVNFKLEGMVPINQHVQQMLKRSMESVFATKGTTLQMEFAFW